MRRYGMLSRKCHASSVRAATDIMCELAARRYERHATAARAVEQRRAIAGRARWRDVRWRGRELAGRSTEFTPGIPDPFARHDVPARGEVVLSTPSSAYS